MSIFSARELRTHELWKLRWFLSSTQFPSVNKPLIDSMPSSFYLEQVSVEGATTQVWASCEYKHSGWGCIISPGYAVGGAVSESRHLTPIRQCTHIFSGCYVTGTLDATLQGGGTAALQGHRLSSQAHRVQRVSQRGWCPGNSGHPSAALTYMSVSEYFHLTHVSIFFSHKMNSNCLPPTYPTGFCEAECANGCKVLWPSLLESTARVKKKKKNYYYHFTDILQFPLVSFILSFNLECIKMAK